MSNNTKILQLRAGVQAVAAVLQAFDNSPPPSSSGEAMDIVEAEEDNSPEAKARSQKLQEGTVAFEAWLRSARRKQVDPAPMRCDLAPLTKLNMDEMRKTLGDTLAAENKKRMDQHWPPKAQLTDALAFKEIPLTVPFGSNAAAQTVTRPMCNCCGYVFWLSNASSLVGRHMLSADHMKSQHALGSNPRRREASNLLFARTQTRAHLQAIVRLKAAAFLGDHPTLSFTIGAETMELASRFYAPVKPLLMAALEEAKKNDILQLVPSLHAALETFSAITETAVTIPALEKNYKERAAFIQSNNMEALRRGTTPVSTASDAASSGATNRSHEIEVGTGKLFRRRMELPPGVYRKT